MTDTEELLDQLRSALRSEPRVDLHRYPIHLSLEDDTLILEGEVQDVAAKKLALKAVAAVPGFSGIVDRLHVQPATPMGDGEIRDKVRDALLQEPALADIRLLEEVKGERLVVRDPPNEARGEIAIIVKDGVVTLDGDVPSLAQKRLSGVLAWWVPGSRDVINGLGLEPPEEDSDEEITEAVRVALDKDVFVNAGQIRVGTRNAVVTLAGLVPTDAERDMAEFDAWFVLGVNGVDNRIEVRPVEHLGRYG
jgi:osmotically-inducible protein OsmY